MKEDCKILLRLSFDGTRYRGYQVQKNGPTVQSELNRAAFELFGVPCDVVGCSRTDSGVHALAFYVAVSQRGTDVMKTDIPEKALPRAFNAHLPADVAVNAAWCVPSAFHPRYDVLCKEYQYLFTDSGLRDPFWENRAWQVERALDVEKMNEAAGLFCGTHDFSAFMATGSKIKDAVRTVFAAGVERIDDHIRFTVSANGFLYHMVRIMAGTITAVGLGKMRPEQIPDLIASENRAKSGVTAPPYGLYLRRVEYPQEYRLN